MAAPLFDASTLPSSPITISCSSTQVNQISVTIAAMQTHANKEITAARITRYRHEYDAPDGCHVETQWHVVREPCIDWRLRISWSNDIPTLPAAHPPRRAETECPSWSPAPLREPSVEKVTCESEGSWFSAASWSPSTPSFRLNMSQCQ